MGHYETFCANPANPIYSANAGLMIDQHHRRWLNINPTLAEYIAFVGKVLCSL